MNYNIPDLKGLTEAEVTASRKKYGYNRLEAVKKETWIGMLIDILKEPMLILLICVAFIYLIIGDYGEAVFMLVAIIGVTAISFYQDNRSRKALEELEKLNEPLSKVISDGISFFAYSSLVDCMFFSCAENNPCNRIPVSSNNFVYLVTFILWT